MILSHKHKFVFIKGEKVAGTSAEIALSQICGPDDIITPITPIDERHRLNTAGEPRNYASHLYPAALRRYLERRFVGSLKSSSGPTSAPDRAPRCRFFNHMDLRTVLHLVPDANDYEVLFVERSPYAKVMSLANWIKHFQTYNTGGELPTETSGLIDAVDRVIADGSIVRVRNIDRYRDLKGGLSARPWRSETLADDIAAFFKSHGAQPVSLVNAKRATNSDSIDPAKVLRPDQISTINDIFEEEFELFGWTMID